MLVEAVYGSIFCIPLNAKLVEISYAIKNISFNVFLLIVIYIKKKKKVELEKYVVAMYDKL